MITARIKLEYVHECPPKLGVPYLVTIAAWVDPQTRLLDWAVGAEEGHLDFRCPRCGESLPNYAEESDMNRVRELQS